MQKKDIVLNRLPILILGVVILISYFFYNNIEIAVNPNLNSGDMAWMLTCSGLVFLMTPGLAFFYAGMVSKKNVLSTLLQSFICLGLVSILWVVYLFSLAFGDSIGGFIGNPFTYLFFNNVFQQGFFPTAPTIHFLVFAFFQLKFAIITPALITGAFAERINFKGYLIFIILFSTFIYAPIAHMVWHPDGFLFKLGVIDFAGGTVVHITAGVTALVCAWFLKGRSNKEIIHKPARISYVILGTGLLWFGWYGFNAGSAYSANKLAALAFSTTNIAAGTAAISWLFLEAFINKKPSALGFCIGAVVGLVAITPCAGFVNIPAAMAIGFIASIICFLTVKLNAKTGLDDTLDVFPCHGMGGIVGTILTGIFASKIINPDIKGGLLEGNFELFKLQLLTTLSVILYVVLMAYVILKITNIIYPLRVSNEDEELGLDLTQHGESL